jgi:uncharacterized RDD family membrane protein YckC
MDGGQHEERLEDRLSALSVEGDDGVSALKPALGLGQRAGAVSRFAAFFADAVVIAVSLRSAAWLLGGTARVLGRFAPPVHLKPLLFTVAPLLIAIYNVAFWKATGQTPGKWLMGIKVVPVEGGRLPLRRAVVRLGGYLISALPFYLGCLWILGPERLGWHDRVARTEVRYLRRQPASTIVTAEELRRRIAGAVTLEDRVSYQPPPAGSKLRPRP